MINPNTTAFTLAKRRFDCGNVIFFALSLWHTHAHTLLTQTHTYAHRTHTHTTRRVICAYYGHSKWVFIVIIISRSVVWSVVVDNVCVTFRFRTNSMSYTQINRIYRDVLYTCVCACRIVTRDGDTNASLSSAITKILTLPLAAHKKVKQMMWYVVVLQTYVDRQQQICIQSLALSLWFAYALRFADRWCICANKIDVQSLFTCEIPLALLEK